MTFTFLSVFLTAVCLLFVGMGVLKGMKKGLMLSALDVAAVLLGALVASALAMPLSNPIAREIYDRIYLSPLYLEQFPSVKQVILAAADALVTPVVFVPLFFLCCWIVRLLIWLISLRIRAVEDPAFDYCRNGKTATALHKPGYAAPDAPAHIRQDRLLGGIVRGFCGFLMFLLTVSPVLGAASAGRMALRLEQQVKLNMTFPEEIKSAAEPYCYDAATMVFSAAGGSLVYTALGITNILGAPVEPREELEETAYLVSDLSEVIAVFSREETLNPEQLEMLDGIAGRMEGNRIARLLAADILNELCRSWLMGSGFYGVSRPQLGTYADTLMDALLQAIRGTTEYTVVQDMDTLMQLFAVLMTQPRENFSNVDFMLSSGMIDGLFEILDANPRTAHLTDSLVQTSFVLVARAVAQYGDSGKWAENLVRSVNRLNGMTNADFATRVKTLGEDLTVYCEDMGIQLSTVAAQMAATVLYSEFQHVDTLTTQTLMDYLNSYGQ